MDRINVIVRCWVLSMRCWILLECIRQDSLYGGEGGMVVVVFLTVKESRLLIAILWPSNLESLTWNVAV